jgi:hypothetical protein
MKDWKTMIDFDIDINASVFETNIRSKCSHCSIVFEGTLVLPDHYCHIYVTPNGLIKLISKTFDLV